MLTDTCKNSWEVQEIPYQIFKFYRPCTNQKLSQLANLPKRALAKTWGIHYDDKIALLITPVDDKPHLADLKSLFKSRRVELLKDESYHDLFANCQPGAVPDFSALEDMDIYISRKMNRNHEIVFPLGSRQEWIKMSFKNFAHLIRPKYLD